MSAWKLAYIIESLEKRPCFEGEANLFMSKGVIWQKLNEDAGNARLASWIGR